MEPMEPRRSERKRTGYRGIFLALAGALTALAVTAVIGWHVAQPYIPSQEEADWYKGQLILVMGDEIYPGSPLLTQREEFLIPLSLIQKYIDGTIFWEPGYQAITITNRNTALRMRTQQLTAYLNQEPVDLSIPVVVEEEEPYLPLDLLVRLYGIEHGFSQESQTLVLELPGTPRQTARVLEETAGRLGPGIKEPIISRLNPGDKVTVLEEREGWYRIRDQRGILSHIPKQGAELEEIIMTAAHPREDSASPWRPMGERIILTWDYVGGTGDRAARFAEYPDMPGVNVISPTWFHLKDQEGNLVNLADPSYVAWAAEQGLQVWALVSNGFDPDRTRPVLRDPDTRDRVIRQLLAYAALYQLDGINVDFENMYQEDRDYFSQFIRELAPPAREQGLTISVDVTAISQSPTWSLCYDRPALAQAADYLILMAYDQHPAASQVAGPVSGLDWTERILKRMLQEVPRERLILGMPFYTRLWKEEPREGGGTKVSSQALSMAGQARILEEKNPQLDMDEGAGLRVATYEEGPVTYRMWLEEPETIRNRARLADLYGLPGVASWRRGFEDPAFWEVLREEMAGPPR